MKILCPVNILLFILFVNVARAANNKFLLSDSSVNTEKFTIKNIDIIGNRVTKSKVVSRELTFKINDTVALDDLELLFERSRENLLKTSLFNYIYFDTLKEETNLLKITITLEERWFTWPEIHFNHADRNLSAWWQSGDFSRINYGLGLSHYNFRGHREKISIKGITGFTTQYAFTYENIYLDRHQRHSLSVGVYYDKQNKLEYITENNRPKLFKADKIIYQKQNYFFRYTYRKKLYETHRVVAGYLKFNIADTIMNLNPDFLGREKDNISFLTFIYYFESDRTDLKYYPLKGSLFNGSMLYSGFLNSGFNKLELRTGYFRFFKLDNRIYANAGLKMQYTAHTPIPYIILAGLGYDNFLRGYEKYVVDGYNFLLFKSTIKYQLIPVKIVKLNFLPLRQFNKIHFSSYLNLFFDAGYVYDYYQSYKLNGNTLVNKALYSFGTGIDFVTYYDKMLRIDLAHNSIGDWGVFVSMIQKL